MVGKVLIFV